MDEESTSTWLLRLVLRSDDGMFRESETNEWIKIRTHTHTQNTSINSDVTVHVL